MSDQSSLAAVLGTTIRKLRKEQGLTMQEVSRISGLAIATLSDLENGVRDTRVSSYDRVFEALRVDPAQALAATIKPEVRTVPAEADAYDLDL